MKEIVSTLFALAFSWQISPAVFFHIQTSALEQCVWESQRLCLYTGAWSCRMPRFMAKWNWIEPIFFSEVIYMSIRTSRWITQGAVLKVHTCKYGHFDWTPSPYTLWRHCCRCVFTTYSLADPPSPFGLMYLSMVPKRLSMDNNNVWVTKQHRPITLSPFHFVTFRLTPP